MIGMIRGEYNYDIYIFNRISKLVGLSGEGKTLLGEAVGEINDKRCTFSCDNTSITEILFIPSDMLTKDVMALLDYRTSCIIFIDEGALGDFKISQLALLRKSVINNNYLVFIERDNNDYSYDIKALLSIIDIDSKRVMYPIYNIRSELLAFDNIVTEDSKSGLSVITKIFNKTCNSSFGKSNVRGLIKIQSNAGTSDSLLYIVDGLVFGSHIEACVKASSKDNFHFMFIPSLEYLLLVSMKLVDKEALDYELFIGSLDEDLKSDKFDIDIVSMKTPERYYEWLLKTNLRMKYNIEYSKKDISNIVDMIDFDIARKELFSYLDSYWGYVELTAETEEKESLNNKFESFRNSFT